MPGRSSSTLGLGAAALLVLTACHGATHPAAAPQPTVHAAYVLLVEGPDGATVPFARVIVDSGDDCPELHDPESVDEPIVTTPRHNPHGFEVRVCEAVYPYGRTLSIAGGMSRLPKVSRQVTRVAVLGDTGCKPTDQGNCPTDDPSEWPLPAISTAAAAGGVDLVLHMGDYNYRGTSAHFEGTVDGKKIENQWVYDAGDGATVAEKCGLDAPYYSQNSSGSVDPDRWDAWRLDFFEPAADLLAAAPWVFARGNHELCSRAGPGWFYFLGPSSDLLAGDGAQTVCPSQEGQQPAPAHIWFDEPYTVRLGDLAISVVDSANACDEQPNFVEIYGMQFSRLAEGIDASTRWLMTHRPLWGAADPATDAGIDCSGEPSTGPVDSYTVINLTMECALRGEVGAALLPQIDLGLAGHMHRFEWLEFAADSIRPPMLIVGNSGVSLNTDEPNGAFSQPVDGEPASGFGLDQFGYVEMVLDPGGDWRGEVVAVDPAAWSDFLAACDSTGAADGFLCVRPLSP